MTIWRYLSHRDVRHAFAHQLDTQSLCGKSTLWGLGTWLEDHDQELKACRNCLEIAKRQQPQPGR